MPIYVDNVGENSTQQSTVARGLGMSLAERACLLVVVEVFNQNLRGIINNIKSITGAFLGAKKPEVFLFIFPGFLPLTHTLFPNHQDNTLVLDRLTFGASVLRGPCIF